MKEKSIMHRDGKLFTHDFNFTLKLVRLSDKRPTSNQTKLCALNPLKGYLRAS